MSAGVSYDVVMNVTLSWDSMKRTPNYQEIFGEKIFTRMFHENSGIRALFGFSPEEDISANPRLRRVSSQLVDMIDFAVGVLGPDLDQLEGEFRELGKRHAELGVRPHHFDVMRDAVLSAFREILGTKFTEDDRHAWSDIFQYITSKLLLGVSPH